ncbi:HNH endonuclease [Nocardioides alcanivorans]|uniref:HNH endonuclease n=1 Tax=Nocardioides alcanivorans TaxID=2897352 RepID=UPI001F20532C|nr:HNH endonuclease [Nocardioides alcanivorans]
MWDPEALTQYPWIEPYVDVPPEATPPLAMTPPPPDAVGSYGPELIEWARVTMGVKVRWWQGLAIVRILEHRADGSLCWEEVVKSCSRRSGKSVIVRLLAVWRLVFAPRLFGEMQLIVHSASSLRIAKEPMRYAAHWARNQENLEVYTNNNNYSFEDKHEGHRWIVVPPDKTAGLDTCMGIVDEAWKCLPEIVDDDLEPSLMERVSPQLLLISTAHRRASSLMRGRIAGALAGEDMERVLILLWAAQPTMDPGAVETWRAASPHWTPERERYLARKYEKALRGEIDPEADDPDPMEGFRAQYLNMWPLAAAKIARGTPLIAHETVWNQLRVPAPDRAPDAVAIEAGFETGVAVASAWRHTDDAAIVRVVEAGDVATAAHLARQTGFRGKLTVGASLLTDPAFNAMATAKGQGTARGAVLDVARLLADGDLRHDGSPALGTQVLAVRTVPGSDGPRLASQSPIHAVKAAVWAATAARKRRRGRTRLGLPSGV